MKKTLHVLVAASLLTALLAFLPRFLSPLAIDGIMPS